MFCESCGARIPNGSTFCEECGAKIAPAAGEGKGAGNSGPKIIPRVPEPSAKPIPPEPNIQGNRIPPAPQVQSAPIPPTPPTPNTNYQAQQESAAPAGTSGGSGMSGNTKTIIMAAAGVLAVAIIVIVGIAAKKAGLIGGKSDKDDNQITEASSEVMPENAQQQAADTTAATETAAETQAQEATESPAQTADQSTAAQASEDTAGDYSQTASGSITPSITGPDQDVVIQDFDWFYDDGFPEDGTPYKELWGLGGKWKSLLYAQTPVDGKEMCRIVISDADVQYMGYKLTVLLNTKARYQYPGDARDQMELLDNSQVTMTFEGDWDEEQTSMDVYSLNSDLNCKINKFVSKNGFDYAIGPVYNGDTEIGKVMMIRATP
ncbi:zinc ribbon domain-containing protein [Butyrivibrio sp. NC2007]|uniref:zinc ribbon domain-containing protein n=1 Tax=Butyrivibrio sp. NC2007 TaxID=1280683 RepID=UPI0003B74CF3|nr:zinc ribbon domain-containing protein [Butyrivibrio sp. NC2007]